MAPDFSITRNRYYSPALQRFVSGDPIGLSGGVNPYEYVSNGPTLYGDPLGLYPLGYPLMPNITPGTAERLGGRKNDDFDWWGYFWADYGARQKAWRDAHLPGWINKQLDDPSMAFVGPCGMVAPQVQPESTGPYRIGEARSENRHITGGCEDPPELGR